MPSVFLAPGTVLKDRYRIEKKIGQGGFGIIYKAYDLQLKNTIVVKEFFISRLMYRQADSAWMEVYPKESPRQEVQRLMTRFLAEARCMAKLGKQETIPNVYDFFEANHTAYIVMELLEGETLRQYMYEHQQKLPLDLALFITGQVAEALSVLHENEIIHRDIAPDNIFLCDNTTIQVKTLDFGGARLMDATDQTLSAVLKVGYSPVEQYDHSQVHIGPWTDVYALGATLYFMLTGMKPIESTIRKKKDELKAPHELKPEIPEYISNAIMKAMAVDYRLRYQTVGAFMDALNGKGNGLPLEKEIRRRRMQRAAGIAVILLLLTAAGIFVARYYANKRAEGTLQAAALSVWICAADGSGEEDAMREIISDFQTQYPQITIELSVFSETDYIAALEKAAAEDALPDLFESSGASDAVLQHCCDLSPLLTDEYVSQCLFLDDYLTVYPEGLQFPLGIEVPLAFIITDGDTVFPYEEPVFDSLEDLNLKTIAADRSKKTLLNANYDFGTRLVSWQDNGYLDAQNVNYPVFLSTSMNLEVVREHLLAFESMAVPYASSEIKCRYVYEWSIASKADPARIAALRLLSWMTSESYQEALMITECSEGPLPINRECFLEKADFIDLAALKDLYQNFTFGGWQHE